MESKFIFLIHIAAILLAANIGGIISRKLKQPAVLGQIVAGIILGLFFYKTETVTNFAEIGVIFLMFIAGLETDVEELKKSGKSSSLIALGGIITPLALVMGGMYLVTGDFIGSLFMGVIATATSISISIQTLIELGQMKTKQGIGILGAAIIDDIVGIILLTVVIGVVKPGAESSFIIVVGKIISFFILAFIIGYIVITILSKLSRRINIEDKITTYAVIFCLTLAFLSEELGVAAITGAYFAGIVFSMTTHKHKLSHDIHNISSVMFTPIFFVAIGLGIDLSTALEALGIGILLAFLAALGKVIGCGLGAGISGFNKREALQVGVGMIPRAEVAIIITNLGIKIGVITHKEMAAVILMVLITTIMTPSLLKLTFEEDPKKAS
ncbi:MAG: hypothetical protein PWQ37_275 [Candidatus Petromonas sp.]|jgi:Kef-type K+ transport system membrane component KefB|nr:hypothetical protein [Candidatus Petromonas sp.]